MRLVQTLLLRHQVLQWLVLPISLWVAIVCSLAFSGSAAADLHEEPMQGFDGELGQRTAPHEDRANLTFIPSTVVRNFPAPRPMDRPYPSAPRLQDGMLIDGTLRPRLPASSDSPFLLQNECPTPMSLMLHAAFGPAQMRELARKITMRGYITTTYREIKDGLSRGICPAEGSIVISLDDFPTDWLRSEFVSLIEIFAERELVLVIAANVRGPQDPDAWNYLRNLEDRGFEVASHTIDHYSLSQLEPERIHRQVVGSYEVICRHLGRCPTSLILPFGNLDEAGHTVEAASKYSFLVGIPGGRWFGGQPPFYVGRIGPSSLGADAILRELAASFGVERSQTYAMRGLEQLRIVRCFASPVGGSPHFSCARTHSADLDAQTHNRSSQSSKSAE